MNLGTTTIDVVSDGTFLMDGGCLFGQIPKTEWELQIKPDRRNRIRLALNCMLIQTPEFNVLVDTGVGSKRQDKMKEMIRLNGNKLLKGLKAKGITARDIDAVILSNLHFDHSGGCTKLDRSGTPVPTFPKARYLVQKSSWQEANSPNERYRDIFHEDDFLPLAERDMLEFIDDKHEVLPGLTVKVTNGPSDGHQIVLVERGSEKIAHVSDLIPTPYHLPLPYIPAMHEYPNTTLEQKREFIDMAVEGGWLVVFGHAYEQNAGYIVQKNGATQFLPVEV